MQEKQLTPKEQFDAEMKEINRNISKKNGTELDEEFEEDLKAAEEVMDEQGWDEPEDEPVVLDKNLGDAKVSQIQPAKTYEASNEDFQAHKLNEVRSDIMNKLKAVGGLSREKLSPDDQKKMMKILTLFQEGKVKNPILKHLINKKLDHTKKYAELQVQVKQVQLEIVQKMAKLTDEVLHAENKSNIYNKDILELADDFDKE